MDQQLLLISIINGLSYGLLLFLLSAGLTLILSIMRVLNMAHGSFYMLGAYTGYSLTCMAGVPFYLALLLTPCIVGMMGNLAEKHLISKIRAHARGHLAELLLTYGIALVIFSFVQLMWGKSPVEYTIPNALQGSLLSIQGIQFPVYRGFIMLLALAVLSVLIVILRYTKAGILLKAAAQNAPILESFGYNVPRLWACVFALGCALAGLAGVMGGFAYVTEPGMAQSMGMLLFVIVIIGGLGSLMGALVASMLIGVLQTIAVGMDLRVADFLPFETSVPLLHLTVSQCAPLLPFLLLMIVLLIRPLGLFGARDHVR